MVQDALERVKESCIKMAGGLQAWKHPKVPEIWKFEQDVFFFHVHPVHPPPKKNHYFGVPGSIFRGVVVIWLCDSLHVQGQSLTIRPSQDRKPSSSSCRSEELLWRSWYIEHLVFASA